MGDWDDIYYAIGTLEDARRIINDQVRGTADWKHDWVKSTDITLQRARAAYDRLLREHKP